MERPHYNRLLSRVNLQIIKIFTASQTKTRGFSTPKRYIDNPRAKREF